MTGREHRRDRLRRRLRTLPRRTRLVLESVVGGVILGAGWALLRRLFGDSWGDSALYGAIYGVGYSAFALPLRNWLTGRTEGYAAADPATRKAAEKALRSGPPPEDPQVRALAHEMAVDRLPRAARFCRTTVVGLLLLAAAGAVLAVLRGPQAWVAVALFLALAAGFALLLRRLRRRAALLAF